VYNLIGICNRELRKAGFNEAGKEMQERIFACNSYDEALRIMAEYCDVR
jgi:hypothetical protein